MSYEQGGLNAATFEVYGESSTPMALDIAALQHMYGANSSAHSGNTTYRLTDAISAELDVDGDDGDNTVSIGRAFYSIWDTGGTDTIFYAGDGDSDDTDDHPVVINLNDATLNNTPYGPYQPCSGMAFSGKSR